MPSAPAKTVCQQNSGNRWNQAAERVNKIVVPEFVDAFSGPCRRPCRPRPAVVGDIAPASFIQPCQQTPGNHWNQAVFPVNKIVATGLVDTLPLMIVGQSRPSRRVTADIPPHWPRRGGTIPPAVSCISGRKRILSATRETRVQAPLLQTERPSLAKAAISPVRPQRTAHRGVCELAGRKNRRPEHVAPKSAATSGGGFGACLLSTNVRAGLC